MLKYITDAHGAPAAIGPYSQAVEGGNLVFLSGQIPLNPENGEIVSADVKEQTKQVMSNLSAVLAHSGLTFRNVMKSTIYLSDMNNFSAVNEVYENCLEGVKPARATVEVARLPKDVLVEIDMIAFKS
ncbi:MAG: RidA family protein [Deltaproteobacteria bacterium]|nr:RidA family protein [Deltaproteobacteria bacterium]